MPITNTLRKVTVKVPDNPNGQTPDLTKTSWSCQVTNGFLVRQNNLRQGKGPSQKSIFMIQIFFDWTLDISPGGLQIQDQSWPQNMRPWQIKAVHSRARALLVHWSVKGDLGVIVGQVRIILSITAVRAQAECLLSRLRHVGSGAEGSEGGGELGKGGAGTGLGQEAGDVPPELGGKAVSYLCVEGVGQGAHGCETSRH